MLKELFITGLLSFSVGSTPLKYAPKHNLSGNGLYSLYGCYCYQDYFDDSYVALHYDDVEDCAVIDQYNYTRDGYECRVTFATQYDDFYSNNTIVRTLEFYKGDTIYDWNVHIYEGEYSLNESIDVINDSVADLHEDSQQMVLFFPQPLYVELNTYLVFTSFFTNEGNRFVDKYSGWYTLTNTTRDNNINFNGFITIDNNLYNQFQYLQYNANAYLNVGYSNNQYSSSYGLQVVDNKKLLVSANFLFSETLVPNYLRTKLQAIGTFAYVYEPVQYTFGDMIFSVVDAPVYMLSQLFSFEIFGLQFYVAFMGIVTIVLICFILKKII